MSILQLFWLPLTSFLIFLMKREISEKLRQDFDNSMIIWLANLLGNPVGFERKNSLWGQNSHKTSPMSIHVDIAVRCLIFSIFETFVKISSVVIKGNLLSDTWRRDVHIYVMSRSLMPKNHNQLTICFVLLKLKI